MPIVRPSSRRLSLVFGLVVLIVAGCSQEEPPRTRWAREYFAANNTAARHGPEAQQEFLRRSQHPEFRDQTCELGEYTVDLDPAWSTLRPDPGFAPDGSNPPGGDVWIIGVEVTTRRGGTVVGHQIGSQHLVFLHGRTFGFAPCPT